MTAMVAVAVRYGLLAVAARQRRRVAVLQFLLPAADLHLHDHRSDQRRRLRASSSSWRCWSRNVAARVRIAGRGRDASARARPKPLYAFSRKLAGVGTLDDVLWATAYQTALMLKVRVVLLLPENGSIAVKAGYPPEDIARRRRSRGRQMGLGEQPRRRARLGHACRAPSGCSCRCAPAAARSASSASTATSRARCSRPISAGCSTR